MQHPSPDQLPPAAPGAAEARWLRWSVAFVWLATGVAVFHPHYREVGSRYLGRLGLPDWLMAATCVFEVLLGLRVALGRASTAITILQAGMIVVFTAILAGLEPLLLVDPYGMLAKNLPLLSAIGAAWLYEREGWSRRALWLLRTGVASIWIVEGILPKMVFPQEEALRVVAGSGLVWGDPVNFLRFLGLAEAASGVAVLLLRGRPLRLLLGVQATALVILSLLVAVQDPLLLVHPFGPLTKNVPLVVATLVLVRRANDTGRAG
jgi:hypothetical protein